MSNSPAPSTQLRPRTANDFIEQQLDDRILEIENRHTADAISFCGPIVFGVDDILRIAVEKKYNQKPRRNKMVVLLTTLGGYIEVVQRMVDILRSHYKLVDFVVPNYAYSAGTVLAMSGDAIYMDYYSRLGPIDPQVESQSGRPVPALGYLERYKELLNKANSGTISTAEVQILLQFDQAELYEYEQARELSITLLKQWLVKYKFKNWRITETRKLKVNKQMKTDRAESIAIELNNTKKWYVHGHGISMDVLVKDLNLLIDDFGKDQDLSTSIRAYHDLFADYMAKTGAKGAIHFAGDYTKFI